MKKTALSLLLCAFVLFVQAQVKDPVTWKFEAKKKNADTYELVATATLEKPWHIYSQKTGKGPLPTKFIFNPNPLLKLEGAVKESGKLEKVFDNNFNAEVLSYANKVVFTQLLKLKTAVKTNISGKVEFMVCNNEQCLPPTKKVFDVLLQ